MCTYLYITRNFRFLEFNFPDGAPKYVDGLGIAAFFFLNFRKLNLLIFFKVMSMSLEVTIGASQFHDAYESVYMKTIYLQN
jgi:hypothetical protein